MENDIVTPQYRKRKQPYLTLGEKEHHVGLCNCYQVCVSSTLERTWWGFYVLKLLPRNSTLEFYSVGIFVWTVTLPPNYTNRLSISRGMTANSSYKNSVYPNGEKMSLKETYKWKEQITKQYRKVVHVNVLTYRCTHLLKYIEKGLQEYV